MCRRMGSYKLIQEHPPPGPSTNLFNGPVFLLLQFQQLHLPNSVSSFLILRAYWFIGMKCPRKTEMASFKDTH